MVVHSETREQVVYIYHENPYTTIHTSNHKSKHKENKSQMILDLYAHKVWLHANL
ncbi:hypothetical protein Hanom_Chr07g00589981 [Helianthus anomalus]